MNVKQYKREIAKRGLSFSGKKAKFIDMRNSHDAGERFAFLADAKVDNNSLLQRIRIKFWMKSA